MIELKIYQYNASGQVVKSFDVDLYDNAPINVNKSIVDIKEPEQRKSDYTLSIDIPATANNRKVFGKIDNLNRSVINDTNRNFNPDFNPNLKAEAIVFNNGVEQMRGYLQLTEIPIEDGNVVYQIVIIGKLANLFQDIGEKDLTELDLSEFDHNWTYSNVEDSWATSIIKNGIAYNNFNVSGNPSGEGYVYPLIDNGTSVSSQELIYDLEKTMFPSIYVKQLIDSIFNSVGYRYQSNFFESTLFKKLLIPFTGGKFTMAESEVNDRTFIVTQSDTTYTTSNTGLVSDYKQLLFDTVTQDTLPASVNISTDSIVIPSGNQGFYKLLFDGDIDVINNTGATIIGQSVIIDFYFARDRGGVITSYLNSFTVDMTGIPNGGAKSVSVSLSTPNIDLLVGDEVFCSFVWKGIRPIDEIQIKIKSGYQFRSSPNTTYAYGQNISLNSVLPTEIKQSEFLVWIFRMFNLYAISDKIDPKKLIIEPRDDFYTNDVVDITNYLDVSKTLKITPMGELDFRVLNFSYKADNDEYNEKYQGIFNEPYSSKKVEIVNDFLRKTKKIEVGFSATPLANASNHDRIYSKIRKLDPPTQDADLPSFNLRILYYGGLVNTTKNWRLRYNYTTSIELLTSFPYAGMLDNPLNPTFDLGWAIPKAINYGNGNTTITNANLYNLYWKKTIEEITNKDSAIVEAYFHLTENQFNNLDFRKLYKIDKQYYRLYNVSHDLTSNKPIKIEFLKLKTAQVFTPTSGTTNGGVGVDIGNEEAPSYQRSDNSKNFSDIDLSKLKVAGSTSSEIFIEQTNQIQFLDGANEAYMPDANLPQPDTGAVVFTIKNINGSNIKIYCVNDNQTINGDSSYTLTAHHVVQMVAYNGNYQIINKSNTGGS
jgi:hypothetical protein